MPVVPPMASLADSIIRHGTLGFILAFINHAVLSLLVAIDSASPRRRKQGGPVHLQHTTAGRDEKDQLTGTEGYNVRACKTARGVGAVFQGRPEKTCLNTHFTGPCLHNNRRKFTLPEPT